MNFDSIEYPAKVTIVDAVSVERSFFIAAGRLDDHNEHQSGDLTRNFSFDAGYPGDEWRCYDLDWHAWSVCVWRQTPFEKRAYVTLSREGDVEIALAGGDSVLIEQMPDAGVWSPLAKDYGYVLTVREIGSHLYVCGANRQVYRRTDEGEWVHWDAGILQPPYTLDTPMENERCLIDINGLSEDSIYTCGTHGELFHYNGQSWKAMDTGVDEQLNAILCLEERYVFVAGYNGTLLLGNPQSGFRDVSSVHDNQVFTGMAWFDDTLFLASDQGLFVFNWGKGRIEPYQTDLQPPLQDCHVLDARDGVLWSFGYKDLAWFDGRTWTRVSIPDNPPIV